MKNLLLAGICLALLSCGSSGPTDEQNKQYSDMLDSYVKDYETAVDAYCGCVSSKGMDSCSIELDQMNSAYSIIEPTITSAIENGLFNKQEKIDEIRNKTKELFDKKAKCAQDAMNKPM